MLYIQVLCTHELKHALMSNLFAVFAQENQQFQHELQTGQSCGTDTILPLDPVFTHDDIYTSAELLVWLLQLVIYGITGAFVSQQNLQDEAIPGAVHNVTQYVETYLIPGGPVTSLNAIITYVNQGQLKQVAAGFDNAVAHNYTNQLIDVAKEVII